MNMRIDYFYENSEIKDLILLRFWQHQINEILKKGSLDYPIPVHLGIGHEALALAVANSLTSEDALTLTHRNCTYNLACSKSFKQELDFYNLRSNHFKSQMGSMNLAMKNTSILYSSSILGNNIGVGVGIAFNRKLSENNGLVYVLTGDGAIEEGIFWESILLAKTHNLKILIIIENNNYSLGSSIKERRCEINFEKLCQGLSIPFNKASGNNYLLLKEKLESCRGKIDNGPVLLEVDLCTFNQHAGPTPGWATDPKNIDIKDGLIINDSDMDPIKNLKEHIGNQKFLEVYNTIIKKR